MNALKYSPAGPGDVSVLALIPVIRQDGQVRTWIVAVIAAALLCAVVGASYWSPAAIVAVACAGVLMVGLGWPQLLGVPARKTLSTVISLAGIAAVLLASVAPSGMALSWTVVVVALGVMAVFMVQLVRGTGQPHRLESTFGASTGLVLAVLGAGWVAAERLSANSADTGMMLITGISMLMAIAVCVLPWPDRIVAPLGVLLAVLAGTLGASISSSVPLLPAALVGAVAGTVIACFRRLILAEGGPRQVPAALAIGAAPIMASGGLVYFLEKMFLG
jgi:hypothetical protein